MSRVPERLRIDTCTSRATLKYFPLRLQEKLEEGGRGSVRGVGGNVLVTAVCSYMGWGFPLASHSMTMVILGSTMCSLRDCFTMVGGCLTARRNTPHPQQDVS